MTKLVLLLIVLLVAGGGWYFLYGPHSTAAPDAVPSVMQPATDYSSGLAGMQQKARNAGAKVEGREDDLDRQLEGQ